MAFPFPALDGSAPAKKHFDDTPEFGIDSSKRYTATIDTSMGSIVIALDAINAPITVNNFVFLAGYHFYDNVIFHRVVEGFVLQGGDPEGSGMGGPGYRFQDEPVKRRYEYGSLAMANAGANTNGSQFFVVCRDGGGKLQPLYNHFGQVVKGLDVVDAIEAVPVGPRDRPLTPVVINSVTITVAD